MVRRSVLAGLVIISVFVATQSFALQKMKYGTAIKHIAEYFLPVLAAEEQGFWRQNGLEIEWVSFRGGAPFFHAMAAGHIRVGFTSTVSTMQAAAKGVSMLMVAGVRPWPDFYIWVLPTGPIQKPKDLKGAKIAVSAFWGSSHAFGRFMVKTLGFGEKDVSFIATGGGPHSLALLKTGGIDGTVSNYSQMYAELELRGEVRGIVRLLDYLPKPWLDTVVVADKGFVKRNPETIRAVVKAVLQACNFINQNEGWSVAKLKSELGISDKAAAEIYKRLELTRDGEISRKSLEIVRNFLIEYGILTKEEAPPIDVIYPKEFIGEKR